MEKAEYKYKEIIVSLNQDLGKEVDKFLRGDIEIVKTSYEVTHQGKVAHIKYVDRDFLRTKYKNGGSEFKEYMYADYIHTAEISVAPSQNIDEEITKFYKENPDAEAMNEIYLNCPNKKVAILVYTSIKEYNIKEQMAEKEKQAIIEAQAKQLAEKAIKEPEETEKANDVINKYSSLEKDEEEKTVASPVEVSTKKSTKTSTKKTNKK